MARRYLVSRIIRDLDAAGMIPADLTRIDPTIAKGTLSRFLTGKVQSPHTAQKIADALGKPLARYLRAEPRRK